MGLSNILEHRTAESIVPQRIQQTFRLLVPLNIRETGQPQSYRRHTHTATKSCKSHIPKNYPPAPTGAITFATSQGSHPLPPPPSSARRAGGFRRGLSEARWAEYRTRPARLSSAGKPAGPGVRVRLLVGYLFLARQE